MFQIKPKILFLISNFESGGVSKSMASLLNVIDTDKYDVSLWIASPHGVFLSQVPKEIKIITDTRITNLLSGFRGVFNLIKSRNFSLAFGSLVRMLVSKINKSWAGMLLAKLMPRIGDDFYDLIVDYNGQQQLYYMVDKLHGKKKVTFFHNDYHKWPYYKNADKKYFPKVDKIFTISETCAQSLIEVFPEVADKVSVLENISSPTFIKKLSTESIGFDPWRGRTLKLLTVGHICERKGSHWAIEAASILKKRGIDFHWVFVGANPNKVKYDKLIEQFNVADCISMVGVQSNPYPYMALADIIVHPSQFEGKSIALDEAKIMCKPIVVTDFSTVCDQFADGENATICKMTPESIADAIMELFKDFELRNKYKSVLKKNQHDNSEEINKLYNLLG